MLKPEALFVMLLATLAVASLLFSLLYYRLNRMRRDLLQVRRDVGDRLPDNDHQQPRFDRDLVLAELKSKVDQARLATSPPDRYRYVASMVAQGLDHEQISQVLQIGRGEAEQLVSLARLRMPGAGDKA